MNNRKQFFIDIFKNTFAFGIYIAAFHLLMMPYLAKNLASSVNAKLLLFVMISNILTITLGNELGILYQILEGRRPGPNNLNDLWRLLHMTNGLLFILMAGILIVLGFAPLEVVMLAFTSILSNIRFFFQGYLRQKKDFSAIGKGNALYLAGVVVAILLFLVTGVIYWLPLFLAELLAVIMLYALTREIDIRIGKPSKDYAANRSEFIELAGATILTNIPIYSDKVLVLPLLGDVTMSAYYAGTVLSKMMFLVVNPMNAVLLSWLSGDRVTDKNVVIRRQIQVNMIILVVVFLISFPLTYFLMKILYSQFFDQVIAVILPLSLLSAFSIASSFLRVVFLRYYDLKTLKYVNIIHLVVFLTAAPLGAMFYGLGGFTLGVAASKATLWVTFLWMLKKGHRWRIQTVEGDN